MAKLQVDQGPLSGKTYLVARKKPFVIGRSESVQIDLRDTLVSRRHCQVEIKGSQFFARDLGSRNGTFINGRRITFAALYDQDRLQIGHTTLSFHNEETKDKLINREIGGYEINALIGRGGMGTVYRATQLSLNRQTALKVLSPELSKDEEFVKLFLDEARAAAYLDHPRIVKVYEVGSYSGIHYFSMEFIPGGSVEEKLSCSGHLDIEEALHIAREAAVGLSYAANKKMVHRDIKPGNLLLTLDGTIKICDLGIAGKIDLSEGNSFRGGGSPHYIAPEQALGRAVDSRADIYSLGISLYTILAGYPPFTGSSSREIARKHIREVPPPLKEQRKGLSQEICDLVHWMIQKNPKDRPASPDIVAEKMRCILEGRKKRRFKSETQSFVPLLLLGMIVAGAVGLGVFFAHDYVARQAEKRWSAQVQETRELADLLCRDKNFTEAIAMLTYFRENNEGRPGLEWIAPRIREVEAAEAEQKKREQEKEARERLRTLVERNAEQNEFKSFIKQYAGTAAAGEAEEILQKKERSLTQRKQLEESAEQEYNRLAAQSNSYMVQKNFMLASQVLERFPTRFHRTGAHERIETKRRDVLSAARSHMEETFAKALALAGRSETEAAQKLLNGLKLPRPLQADVEKKRAEVLLRARQVQEEKVKAREKADRERAAAVEGTIKRLLHEAGFRAARNKLATLSSQLRTRTLITKIENDIRHITVLEEFFNELCLRSIKPFEFPLISDEPVLVNRLLHSKVEFYEKKGDQMADRKTWDELPPARYVALLNRFAEEEEEKKACAFLADYLGVAVDPPGSSP